MQGKQSLAQRFQHINGGLPFSRRFALRQLFQFLFERRVIELGGDLSVVNVGAHGFRFAPFVSRCYVLAASRPPAFGQAAPLRGIVRFDSVSSDCVQPAIWFSVEQPLSRAASSFSPAPRRGMCHGKNSHFQEFTSGHQTEHYRRSILAFQGVITRSLLQPTLANVGPQNEGDKQAMLPDP